MEKKEFLKIIRTCRRRMNIAKFLEKSVTALSISAGVGILFQAAALLVPLYYVNIYSGLALILGEISVFIVMVIRRTTMEQAAFKMDRFGFEERIATAYENLDKEGTLIGLQREDAMKALQAHRDRIRISIWPSWKKAILCFSLLILLVGLSLIPSVAKDRAKELYSLKGEVKEKEEEIEEMLEALEQLQQEELTEKQQEALNDMAQSLEASLSEYQQAVSQEMLEAASQKLNYKYQDMSGQLSEIMQEIQDGANLSLATADALKAMEDRMKHSQGNGVNKEQGSSGEENDKDGSGRQGQDGDGNSGNGNGQEGQNGDRNSGNGNGQEGQNGDRNSGNGNGQGSQGGNGQHGNGNAPGNGVGNGSVNAPHDYVSVPNEIADSENLTGNVVNHDTSEYFRAQNGLSWEGTHTSYDAVIGSYEQNAYEGIAAGRYPSGMEEIIKEYFASFN